MEISEELKAKALACETAEELLELAAENGIELSPEEASSSCSERRRRVRTSWPMRSWKM